MSQYRHLIVTLGVVALLLLTFGAAAAKDNASLKRRHGAVGQPPTGKGKPARLTWTPRPASPRPSPLAKRSRSQRPSRAALISPKQRW